MFACIVGKDQARTGAEKKVGLIAVSAANRLIVPLTHPCPRSSPGLARRDMEAVNVIVSNCL